MLLHIITEKGRGYLPAESASDKMHGVGQYDPVTGKQAKGKPKVLLRARFVCLITVKLCKIGMKVTDGQAVPSSPYYIYIAGRPAPDRQLESER